MKLKEAAVMPRTLGTARLSSFFSSPRYRTMEALLGTIAPPSGVWAVSRIRRIQCVLFEL